MKIEKKVTMVDGGGWKVEGGRWKEINNGQ
jgi:hypothetical protein